MKWLDVFKIFDCKIHYHPGKENVFIDALTRNPTSEPIRRGGGCLQMLVFTLLLELIRNAQEVAVLDENAEYKNVSR